MVVLSGDPRIPIGDFPSSTIRLAYVSVGEADTRREYWPAVRDQSFLVEPNPDWPANVRVDVRHTAADATNTFSGSGIGTNAGIKTVASP